MTMRRMRPSDRNEDGAVAVEFALLLPILMLVLYGIIEFGFIFNTQIALTQAAREGVRREALGTGDAVATAEAAVQGSAIRQGASAQVVQACPSSTEEARVRVSLNYEPLALPINPIPLRGEAVMRCGG